MKISARVCNVCRKERPLIALSLVAYASARLGTYSKQRAATIGRIELCAGCHAKVVETAPRFPDIPSIETWQSANRADLRQHSDAPR